MTEAKVPGVHMVSTQKFWKIGLYLKKIAKNGYLFLPKWPFNMGRGSEAWAAHPQPNQIWVPSGIWTHNLIIMSPMQGIEEKIICCLLFPVLLEYIIVRFKLRIIFILFLHFRKVKFFFYLVLFIHILACLWYINACPPLFKADSSQVDIEARGLKETNYHYCKNGSWTSNTDTYFCEYMIPLRSQ